MHAFDDTFDLYFTNSIITTLYRTTNTSPNLCSMPCLRHTFSSTAAQILSRSDVGRVSVIVGFDFLISFTLVLFPPSPSTRNCCADHARRSSPPFLLLLSPQTCGRNPAETREGSRRFQCSPPPSDRICRGIFDRIDVRRVQVHPHQPLTAVQKRGEGFSSLVVRDALVPPVRINGVILGVAISITFAKQERGGAVTLGQENTPKRRGWFPRPEIPVYWTD